MTLALDERRVAMLAQFGIRWKESAPAAEEFPVEQGAALRAEPAVTQPTVELGARATGIELMEWDTLADTVAACRACKLCATRRNTVFGVGDRQADWLIVGEAPGENEDIQGEPFVGQAGKLLDNMLRALGMNRREKVFIANVLKCRPPGNRNPEPDEVAQCEPFLRRQVELLQPKIIVAMGRFAVQSLLGTTEAIGKLRGQRHQYAGVPVVVTYHPAYLLRNLPDKAKAWADLCLAREIANQPSS
jgi:DNA polymerase